MYSGSSLPVEKTASGIKGAWGQDGGRGSSVQLGLQDLAPGLSVQRRHAASPQLLGRAHVAVASSQPVPLHTAAAVVPDQGHLGTEEHCCQSLDSVDSVDSVDSLDLLSLLCHCPSVPQHLRASYSFICPPALCAAVLRPLPSRTGPVPGPSPPPSGRRPAPAGSGSSRAPRCPR